jgi:DNA polymerase-3 subunit gamma/tau
MLSAHSFNALLKTLEEPPPHVKFLLATTDPQKLPVTILSRCLQFNLKALPVDRIAAHLQDLLQREMIAFEEPALTLIGQGARGSMRDALSLTDQAIAFSGNQLTEAAVRSMLGSVDRAHVLALLESLAQGNAESVLAALDQVAEQAPDELSLLDELISSMHGLAVAQAVPARQQDERISALASTFTAEQVQLCYDIALRGRRDLVDTANPRAGLEMVLLRMVLFRPDGVLPAGGGGAKKPVESGHPAARVAPAPASASAPAASPAQPQPVNTAPAPAPAPVSAQAAQSPATAQQPAAVSAAPLSEPAPAPETAALTVSPSEPAPVRAEPASTPITPAPAAMPAANTIASVAAAGEDSAAWWAQLVAELPIDGMLRNLAEQAALGQRDGLRWTLLLEMGHQVLATDERLEQLATIVSQRLGSRISLAVEWRDSVTDTPAQKIVAARQAKLEQTQRLIRQDPVVVELINKFGGQLDISSIKPEGHTSH